MDVQPAAHGMPRPRLDADPRKLRLAAALVGGAVPGAVALGGLVLNVSFVAGVAAFGVPIGAMLGILSAVRVTRSGWPLAVLGVAALAPLAVPLLAALGAGGRPDQVVLAALFIGFWAEVLGLPVTLPIAIVAALALRWLGGRPATAGLALAAGLAGIVAVAALGASLGTDIAGRLGSSGPWSLLLP